MSNSNQDNGTFKVVEYRKNKKNNYEEEFRNLQKRLHSPKVDLFERDSSYFVKIELPGVDSNSLKITFKDDQILFVSGSKLKEHNLILDTDKIIYRETKYNDFNRRIKLPGLVEKENYIQDLNQGVLILNIQKKVTKYNDSDLNFNEIQGKSWADL
jgi:HSP20 family protein